MKPGWRACLLAGSVAAALAILSTQSSGHTAERPLREIVLVRGILHASAASCSKSPLALRFLNRTAYLCDAEVQRIAVAAPAVADDESPPPAFDVQGEREQLASLTGAPEGARVTLVAEWRPGRVDLFVIEIDVCPCANLERMKPSTDEHR